MSIEALNWAFDLPIRDMRIKAVLLTLANHHNQRTDCCYPSLALIARSAGCCERNARRILQRMQRMQLVKIDHERGKVSNYEINFLWSEGDDFPVDDAVDNASAPEVDPGQSGMEPRTKRADTPDNPGFDPGHCCPTEPHETKSNLHETSGLGNFSEGWKTIRTALEEVQGLGGAP